MFWSVPKDVITDQSRLFLIAIGKEKNFLQFFRADAWPEDMLSIKNRLLHNTIFSGEILINGGNCNDALDALTEMFQKHI